MTVTITLNQIHKIAPDHVKAYRAAAAAYLGAPPRNDEDIPLISFMSMELLDIVKLFPLLAEHSAMWHRYGIWCAEAVTASTPDKRIHEAMTYAKVMLSAPGYQYWGASAVERLNVAAAELGIVVAEADVKYWKVVVSPSRRMSSDPDELIYEARRVREAAKAAMFAAAAIRDGDLHKVVESVTFARAADLLDTRDVDESPEEAIEWMRDKLRQILIAGEWVDAMVVTLRRVASYNSDENWPAEVLPPKYANAKPDDLIPLDELLCPEEDRTSWWILMLMREYRAQWSHFGAWCAHYEKGLAEAYAKEEAGDADYTAINRREAYPAFHRIDPDDVIDSWTAVDNATEPAIMAHGAFQLVTSRLKTIMRQGSTTWSQTEFDTIA